jgi:Flp pilus assembly protein TadD
MRSALTRVLFITAGACLLAGCALHQTPSPADRFFLHKEMKQTTAAKDDGEDPSTQAREQTLAEARRLMATARPTPKAPVPTLETTDPVLAAALKNLPNPPTVAALYAVGAAYHRRGLIDQAYSYYSRALRLDAEQPETHEALARVWRDWGLPQLGLSHAHRAIHLAPTSASARNTLGTLLHALGLRDEARRAYRLAVLLDPKAAYAYNNLCYLSFVEGNSAQAASECHAALQIDSHLTAAHNNLALINAAMGHDDLARTEFAASGDAASVAYNMGIVYLAQSRYADAADEFDSAQITPRPVVDAERRARDARRLADIAGNLSGGR